MFNKVGAFRKGVTYGWCINGTRDGDDRGMRLKGLGTFYASMRFEIIDADPQRYEKPLRCTTRAYAYKLTNRKGADLWRMHWHPVGHSTEKYPHVHIPPDLDAHMVCPRMTVEKAIQWCITLGAPLTMETTEALTHLELIEGRHKLHRSWSERHDEPHS